VKIVQQSHEERLPTRFSEYVFESPVCEERSIAHGLKRFVPQLFVFWHNNTSYRVKVKPEQKCDIIKGGCEALCNKNWNIENYYYGEAA
jgi:hypothetical protein